MSIWLIIDLGVNGFFFHIASSIVECLFFKCSQSSLKKTDCAIWRVQYKYSHFLDVQRPISKCWRTFLLNRSLINWKENVFNQCHSKCSSRRKFIATQHTTLFCFVCCNMLISRAIRFVFGSIKQCGVRLNWYAIMCVILMNQCVDDKLIVLLCFFILFIKCLSITNDFFILFSPKKTWK